MSLGILSHRRANRVGHTSVAMQDIQDRRAQVKIPGGRPLHEYVNLYICARNPMMYKIKERHRELCILRVGCDILDLLGVIVADRNASSDYTTFLAAPKGLIIVDQELTFSKYWTHSDPIAEYRHKSAKCAEVLVPDGLSWNFVFGIFVSCREAKDILEGFDVNVPISINRDLFFQ